MDALAKGRVVPKKREGIRANVTLCFGTSFFLALTCLANAWQLCTAPRIARLLFRREGARGHTFFEDTETVRYEYRMHARATIDLLYADARRSSRFVIDEDFRVSSGVRARERKNVQTRSRAVAVQVQVG